MRRSHDAHDANAHAPRPRRAARAALLLAALACGGCYTNRPALDRAAAVAKDLDAFRREQSDRLDTVNRRYRFDYAQLIAELTRLRKAQLDQATDLDNLQAGSELLVDWERQTLPKRVRDEFAAAMVRHRQRLLEVDKAIDATRQAYADAYRAVRLNLNQLKAAQAGAEALAVPEDRRRTAADFVQTLARVIDNLRDQEKKSDAAASTTDKP
jgi:hypothetical protein